MIEQTAQLKVEIGQQFEQLYRVYKVEYEQAQIDYRIENVRFVHDPNWRNNWVSIQRIGNFERWLTKTALTPVACVEGTIKDKLFWMRFEHLDTRAH